MHFRLRTLDIYHNALALIDLLPESSERNVRELELRYSADRML
jgi:hypothetical protein